jgi:hypothetical protein
MSCSGRPLPRGAALDGWPRDTGPSRPLRMSFPHMRGDLRTAPLLLELALHDPPQLRLATRQRRRGRRGPPPHAGLNQVAVVDAPVVRPQVAAQLPASGRRSSPQPAGDLRYPQPPTAQGGNPLPFQQRGTDRSGNTPRATPAAARRPGPPSLAGSCDRCRATCRLRPSRSSTAATSNKSQLTLPTPLVTSAGSRSDAAIRPSRAKP